MANVEGNEIALRSVLGQNLPAPRDGSDARSDNDGRPAFLTANYALGSTYGESIAPAWCYGMTYEGPGLGAAPGDDVGPIFVSWGTAAQPGSAETILYPGQTLSFPRAARRVFGRTEHPSGGASAKITWKLDPYAAKTWSPAGTVSTVQQAGAGNNVTQALPIYAGALPRTQLIIDIENTSTVAVTYTLYGTLMGPSGLLVLDTAVIAAGANLRLMYGQGIVIASLPAGFSGHCMAFPYSVEFTVTPNAPPAPGDVCHLSYWYR